MGQFGNPRRNNLHFDFNVQAALHFFEKEISNVTFITLQRFDNFEHPLIKKLCYDYDHLMFTENVRNI